MSLTSTQQDSCLVAHDTELKVRACRIRELLLRMIYEAGSGHPGGSLSAVDVLTYLFFQELALDPNQPDWDGRDRFILSKGHAAPALYAVGVERGWLAQDEILGFRKIDRILQGHPHVRSVPWVETSTGSLGQGFSVAIGMALGLRYRQLPNRVYVMLGDGELQEGEVWEGAMSAAHHRLDNVCAILDYNKMQSDDRNETIMNLEPLRQKWEAFNWAVIEADGHDFASLEQSFLRARTIEDKPTLIIAHTIKGKGVSYMEGIPTWHGSVKLREEELQHAIEELELNMNNLLEESIDNTES